MAPNRYYFDLYKDKSKQWRWRLVAANGKTIADSAEGYKRKIDCNNEIDRIKAYVGYAETK